jgi:hypothetical protein
MNDLPPAALAALRQIARGRRDNGRLIYHTEAMEIARRALIELGLDWTPRGVAHAETAEVVAP